VRLVCWQVSLIFSILVLLLPSQLQYSPLNPGLKHPEAFFFYVYGSEHRWSILIVVQRDATQSSLFIILQVHCTCFGCQPHPSSGVHKTVTTVSGTGHIFCAAWPVPEAVVTVSCTPDDGWGWHPKHVECICRIINRLLFVASRWTVINIDPEPFWSCSYHCALSGAKEYQNLEGAVFQNLEMRHTKDECFFLQR